MGALYPGVNPTLGLGMEQTNSSSIQRRVGRDRDGSVVTILVFEFTFRIRLSPWDQSWSFPGVPGCSLGVSLLCGGCSEVLGAGFIWARFLGFWVSLLPGMGSGVCPKGGDRALCDPWGQGLLQRGVCMS